MIDCMVLLSKITPSSLSVDQRIVDYSAQQQNTPLPETLQKEKHNYQSTILFRLFDFSLFKKQTAVFLQTIQETAPYFNAEAIVFADKLHEKAEQLNEVAIKFSLQIQQLSASQTVPENNTALQVIFESLKYLRNRPAGSKTCQENCLLKAIFALILSLIINLIYAIISDL